MLTAVDAAVSATIRRVEVNLRANSGQALRISSTTMTMWSYTGSAEGQDNLSTAAPTTLVAHVERAMAHTCKIFCISFLLPGLFLFSGYFWIFLSRCFAGALLANAVILDSHGTCLASLRSIAEYGGLGVASNDSRKGTKGSAVNGMKISGLATVSLIRLTRFLTAA